MEKDNPALVDAFTRNRAHVDNKMRVIEEQLKKFDALPHEGLTWTLIGALAYIQSLMDDILTILKGEEEHMNKE